MENTDIMIKFTIAQLIEKGDTAPQIEDKLKTLLSEESDNDLRILFTKAQEHVKSMSQADLEELRAALPDGISFLSGEDFTEDGEPAKITFMNPMDIGMNQNLDDVLNDPNKETGKV